MTAGTVCLAMIVRNESAVIERCLSSVRGIIDRWVIVDTGSTDGTQDIVRRVLVDVPGALYDREWRDFGHNRNELLDLARGSADYLLLLDADMTVEHAGFDPSRLAAGMHMVRVTGGYTYRMPYLVDGGTRWRYVGRTHEYLTSDEPHEVHDIEELVFEHHADGGSRGDKYERDLALLEAAVRENRDDARSVFYLAQTRQGLGDLEGALAAYRRRVELGGWEEEVFWSMYQIGLVLSARDEWVHAAQAYLSAWEYRPTRVEPLYRLAAGYRARNHHRVAALWADTAAAIAPSDDRLFVESWIRDWGIDFERSVSYWWLGRGKESRAIAERLLARDDVDAAHRAALEHNLTLAD